MVKYVALVWIALAVVVVCPRSSEASDSPVVQMVDDPTGMGWDSVTLALTSDGRVVREAYEVVSSERGKVRSIVVLRKLSTAQVADVVEQAISISEQLPGTVDDGEPTVIHAESKFIFVRSEEATLTSTWVGYRQSPASSDARKFSEAWSRLEALLYGHGI